MKLAFVSKKLVAFVWSFGFQFVFVEKCVCGISKRNIKGLPGGSLDKKRFREPSQRGVNISLNLDIMTSGVFRVL